MNPELQPCVSYWRKAPWRLRQVSASRHYGQVWRRLRAAAVVEGTIVLEVRLGDVAGERVAAPGANDGDAGLWIKAKTEG